MHQGWILDSLNLGGSLQSLLLLERAHLGLSAHDATTPLSPGLVVLVHEAILDGGNQLGQLVLVLGTNFGDGQDSGSLIFSQHSARKLLKRTMTDLLVDNSAQTSLALDDGIGDAHLLAQRRQEDDQLNGVDVVGDQDQRGLLVLNEADDVVQAVLDSVGLLADVLLLLALLDSGSLLQETLLLLGLGLGAVLVEELEGLGGGVAVEDVLELGQGGRDLQAHLEDLLLALEADILGPLNHAREVTLGLDVLADAEVSRALLDERVLWPPSQFRNGKHTGESRCTNLGSLLRASLSLRERGRGHLLSGFGGLSLRKEDISELLEPTSLL